jgi:hypothetical protein
VGFIDTESVVFKTPLAFFGEQGQRQCQGSQRQQQERTAK